jgi:uncharacterized membrane protein YadS
MGWNVKSYAAGFTVIYFLTWLCWLFGHYAYIASTDPAKAGIPWSLRMTGEAGLIFALILGLIIGNFAKGFAAKLKEAARPEWYIKTAIVLLGATVGIKAVTIDPRVLANFLFRGVCAIVEAYLIYWALVYWIARRYFGFTREWAAPLASGISICGVSAAIATGAAIRARPIVPIMVSSLVIVFAVVELLILPFAAAYFLWNQPLVAGAWMGLAVKTDGAAAASGAIVDALITGTHPEFAPLQGWILNAGCCDKDIHRYLHRCLGLYTCSYLGLLHRQKTRGESSENRNLVQISQVRYRILPDILLTLGSLRSSRLGCNCWFD